MTLDDVKARVEEIKKLAGDPEAAHSAEDALYTDLLEAIATERCNDVVACAKEAVKAQDIDFPRWCA